MELRSHEKLRQTFQEERATTTRPRGRKGLAIQGVEWHLRGWAVPEREQQGQREARARSRWALAATEQLRYFFSGFSGKPLKGFKQRRDGILKKTEVAKWRVDCKMGTGKRRYQVEAAIIAQQR